MLHQLHIQNYAIIEEIEIKFSEGLHIITGETGAGKSILVGALGLILGQRADSSVLMNKEKKCFIEGFFFNKQIPIKTFFKNNEIEHDDEIVIRREISPNGKSRAFINDTPVNLNLLKELASLLVDLHLQFDTLELGNNDFQREVIDALANHQDELFLYQTIYKKFINENRHLQDWQTEQLTANKQLDYHKFLFEELNDADFRKNELEEIEEELKMISNAENIKATLNKIYTELQEGEQPVATRLKSLSNQLQTLKNFHSSIAELSERLQSVQIELQDITQEIDTLNSSVNFNENKLNALNERLALGYRLYKKHNVNTTNDLLQIKNDLELQLQKITNLGDDIITKQKEVQKYHEEAIKIAEKISINRRKQIKPFEEKVKKLLLKVGMPNAQLNVELKNSDALNFFGNNTIEFLFDANRSNRFEPLRKVASGGELSRLMLIIKSLVAKSIKLPTLIFDEIDTGISGEAARQVGIIMKELSDEHQVISITHQPQIAAKAKAHYFVYKEIKQDRIVTAIRLLNHDERITTIATMLSGERPTAAAFENAREMIGN